MNNDTQKETTIDDLDINTPSNTTEEEHVLTIDKSTNENISTIRENTIERNKLEVDLEEYVDINELGKEEMAESSSVPSSTITESSIARNELDVDLVDINKVGVEDETTQSEHDENINSTTKLNEAGKREIRIEVDETVTKVHERDNKIKKYFVLGLIVICVIIAILIRNVIINNKYELFIRNVKAAAADFMEDDSNASTMYALYNETIDNYIINVNELERKEYIKFELKNPKTGEDMRGTKVEVKLVNGKIEYIYPAG